jgi:hypothetical protein
MSKEQDVCDRIGNASAALFGVESVLPDGDERRAVYRLRIALNDMKARLVTAAINALLWNPAIHDGTSSRDLDTHGRCAYVDCSHPTHKT